MSTELLIISDAVEYGPALGIALAQRGAWRVTIVRDEDAARQARPRGLVLLDSAEAQAGPALARQLHEYGYDVPVLCSARDAGLEAALARLEPAANSLADAPLEPLAGNESDAGNWRYVSEPDFLRLYSDWGMTESAGASEPGPRQDTAEQEPMGSLEGLSDLAGESDGDASAGPELADLARETGARFALLLREQEEIGRAGELDEITWSSLKALAGDGAGPGPARLYLLESGADQEPCLLYVCNAGPLQLSLLVPDDFPVRDLRLACERFLKD
ncbi:MAG: hypothetical protein OXG07_01665 [Anaerolineaceae bacterium]|nr:hypothetical protein [Anaerolineaceae bacterium]MCY3905776.1 hypothetical protein [Anaerolineaceae bacterium]